MKIQVRRTGSAVAPPLPSFNEAEMPITDAQAIQLSWQAAQPGYYRAFDITDRKRARRTLEHASKRYAAQELRPSASAPWAGPLGASDIQNARGPSMKRPSP